MAKEGQKRRLEENKRKLQLYFWAAIGSVVCTPLVFAANFSEIGINAVITNGYLMRYSTVGTWALVGTAAGVICLAAAYNMLHRAADPTYGEDGEIVDAGADLTKSSAQTSMAKDMLWACVILLPPLGISDYAWIVAFCVPLAFGWQAYRTISNSFQGLSGQGAAPPRSQKAEKRAERRRVKRL